jgi:hypothetical protein
LQRGGIKLETEKDICAGKNIKGYYVTYKSK